MKKKITAVLTAIMILFTSVIFTETFTVSAANSASFALKANSSVAVKSSASSSASTLYTLKANEYITALKNAVDGWYQVEYASGKNGYVSSSSVSKVSGSTAATVNISSGSLNVRSGEGTSYDKIGSLSKGQYIVIISKANDWSKVLYNGVSVGYVSNDYVLSVSSLSAVSNDIIGKVADKFVSIALAEEGYKEGSNNYNKYGEYLGNANAAWCDAFVLWCANMTDSALYGTAFPKLRGCTSIMNWYKGKNMFKAKNSGYIPKAGDLVFYNTADSSTTSSTHIGIVTGYSDGYYTSVEGNYSDKVSKRRVSVTYSTVLGFVTPEFSYAKNLIASLGSQPTTTKKTTTTTKKTTTTTKKTTTTTKKTTTTTKPTTTTTTTKPTTTTTKVTEARVSKTTAMAAAVVNYEAAPKAVYAAANPFDTELYIEEIIPAETTSTSVTTTAATVTTTSAAGMAETALDSVEKKIAEEPQKLIVTVDVAALNMRSEASADSDKVSVLSFGQSADVVDETDNYYKLLLDDDIVGYVLKEYVTVSVDETSFGVVDATALNVRNDADMSAEKISVLSDNESLTILEKSDEWYKVKLSNGLIGYVLGCFIVD